LATLEVFGLALACGVFVLDFRNRGIFFPDFVDLGGRVLLSYADCVR
jgi:hypothetical protein